MADVQWSGAVFFGSDFSREEFAGEVSFSKCEFHAVTFNWTQFDSHVVWRESTFFNSEFNATQFMDSVAFESSEFRGSSKFEGAAFRGSVRFSGVTFDRGAAVFNAVSFSTVTFSGATFADLYFDVEDLGWARFEGITAAGSTSVIMRRSGRADFRGAQISAFQISIRPDSTGADREPNAADAPPSNGSVKRGAWDPIVSLEEARLASVTITVAPTHVGSEHQSIESKASSSSDVPDPGDVAPLVSFDRAQFVDVASLRHRGDVDVSLAGIVLRQPLYLHGANGRMRLLSLRASTLEAPLVIGDNVSLDSCRMNECTGLDQLRVVEADPNWRRFRRRRVLVEELESVRGRAVSDLRYPDRDPNLSDSDQEDPQGWAPRTVGSLGGREPLATLSRLARHFRWPHTRSPSASSVTYPDPVRAKLVEGTYRQLRAALEATKAPHAAADFYYGEMEMRRLSCRRWSSTERPLLALYKATSGYGTRASRAVIVYVVVVVATGAALRYQTDRFVADPALVAGSTGLHFNQFWDTVAVAARNSVSFFSGITEGLTAAGVALMFVVRFVGPATFALALLALRSRVQR
jgi:uncharacterized protein YjbI with pentapeptide repeats